MVCFSKPSSSPASFYIIELNNGETIYEANDLSSWKELIKYTRDKDLKIKNFSVQDSSGKHIRIYRNHARFYFVIRSMSATLRGKLVEYKKGYGITAEHPGGIKKTYIRWHDNNNGHFLYNEVIQGINKTYEKEIGVKHEI